MRCSKCGFENGDTSKYCFNCSSPLKEGDDNIEIVCTYCGCHNRKGTEKCVICGNTLSEERKNEDSVINITKETTKPEKKKSSSNGCLIYAIIALVILNSGGIITDYVVPNIMDVNVIYNIVTSVLLIIITMWLLILAYVNYRKERKANTRNVFTLAGVIVMVLCAIRLVRDIIFLIITFLVHM